MPAGTPPTKNRQANELRAQANALRDEVLNGDKLTQDEVTNKLAAAKLLSMRADAAADLTPDGEIERQGGAGADVVRVDGPGADNGSAIERAPALLKRMRGDIEKSFGGTANYLLAVNGRIAMSAGQVECVNRCRAITDRIMSKVADYKGGEMILPMSFEKRTIVGSSGDPSGGEFLLPLQQDPSIFEIKNLQDGMLQRARRYAAKGRTYRIPYLVQTNPANARPLAGIADIQIVGEGQSKPVAEPQFNQRLITVYKYAAISQFGDEELEDDFTGDLQPSVTTAVGGQVLNRINEDCTYDGTGTAMPLAAFNPANPAVLTVARSGGAGAQAVSSDIFKMYSRHTFGPESCWFVSRRTVETLFGLVLTTGSTVTPMVTFLPDLRNQPTMRLLGIPVIVTDLLPTQGSDGDICLGNPEFYAVAMRKDLTVESSIHAAFISDVTTYRFLARAGGLPIPPGWFSYKSTPSGSSGTQIDPHSPFVVLTH